MEVEPNNELAKWGIGVEEALQIFEVSRGVWHHTLAKPFRTNTLAEKGQQVISRETQQEYLE